MLDIRNLTVYYDGHPALQEVSLQVRPGEIVAVIGPNGAGKTTLIRAVSGITAVHDGRILLDGQPIQALGRSARARRIAVVPQGGYLPPAFRVHQTVLLGRTPYLGWLGRAQEDDLSAVASALAETGLTDLRDRIVSELSGGEHQRVLLARALAVGASIMLLDEPTAHLDLAHQAAIFNLVAELARQKDLTVLMVMHDVNHAAAFADRIVLLANGRKMADGPPSEVLTAGNLMESYGVGVAIVPHPLREIPLVLLPQDRPDSE